MRCGQLKVLSLVTDYCCFGLALEVMSRDQITVNRQEKDCAHFAVSQPICNTFYSYRATRILFRIFTLFRLCYRIPKNLIVKFCDIITKELSSVIHS